MKKPLVEALEKLSASHPDESWGMRMVRALPWVVAHFLPAEQVSLRWQENLRTTNGTTFWMPNRKKFVIVLRPIGPYRPPEDAVRTCLHEIAHIRLGHIDKSLPMRRWVTADGEVLEGMLDHLIAARGSKPEVDALVRAREKEAEGWAETEMITLGLT